MNISKISLTLCVSLLVLPGCATKQDGGMQSLSSAEMSQFGAAAPTEAATEQQAQDMVAKAIAHFERHGTDAFAVFNRGSEAGFLAGEVYIAVNGTGPDARVLAHAASPAMVGVPVSDLQDREGKRFAQEFSEQATARGSWFHYQWLNPASGAVQKKKAWVVRHANLVFIAGIYVD
jgi:hypothetical protein